MTMTDPVADMLTRIRNALNASHEVADVPLSKFKLGIAKILKSEGFIKNFKIINEENRKLIRFFLKYNEDGSSVIEGLKRVSRVGRRVYAGKDDLPRVLGGYGVSIITTSRGIMTEKEARQAGLGGEVLCSVW
jgi:small subunit ribosomal protein S8